MTPSKWSLLGQFALHPKKTLRDLQTYRSYEAGIGRWMSKKGKLDFWTTHEAQIDHLMANSDVALTAISKRDKIDFWMKNEAQIDHLMANSNVALTAIGDRLRKITLSKFEEEFEAFQSLVDSTAPRLPLRKEDMLPCVDDRLGETPFDRHYLYHPAWASRILAGTKPTRHVDVSSTLNFCAIVSAFLPVEFYDIRPAPVKMSNLCMGKADLLALPFDDASVQSLSCMHVIEHIGLGRYGEPLDPDGDLKAIRELVRVLAPGGDLLVVTPVGQPRIQFNAHRIYDFEAFRNYFSGLELLEFALVPDGLAPDGLLYDPPSEFVRAQFYGCGCYWFRKPVAPVQEMSSGG